MELLVTLSTLSSTRYAATAKLSSSTFAMKSTEVFAAVAEAYLTGNPVAVCGTAGPGVVHLFNGLMDARKEGAPIIAIAGDVETSLMDTAAIEELNPYKFFEAASLYTGRLVNPEQARSVSSPPRFSLPSWKKGPR